MIISKLSKKKKPLQSGYSVSGKRKILSSIFPTLIIPSSASTVKDYRKTRDENDRN
ncbi:MAG: hypothetical protein IJ725_03600 [Ruminococcus sp.]|nr:hypothetical protein [Ruminococcus sp.]